MTNWIAALSILGLLSGLGGMHAPSPDGSDTGVTALFEGEHIHLWEDWGDAEACLVWGESVECFRTEAALDERLAELTPRDEARASCSGTVRLYDGANYGTPMVALPAQATWHNLSPLGFDNKTSSFRIGGCNALFADGSSGVPPYYSSSLTTAYTQSPSMASGWNNRVSSVRYP